MTLLQIALLAAGILTVAYLTYGRVLSRLLQLNPKTATPSYTERDDIDFVPTESKFLLSQHFSAIAAAGPIVGPIVAGIAFGWLPALIWILIGSVFIGGVHDITALTASIRHKARSIAEVVREHMSERSYLLFLSFIWIALVYIIVAFTDITAASFVGEIDLTTGDQIKTAGGSAKTFSDYVQAASLASAKALENSNVIQGSAIATSSLLYLALPIVMGLLLRYTKLSLNMATLIFVPLIGASIYVGPYLPLSFEQLFGKNTHDAQKIWDLVLLVYCVIAGMMPVWMLLQPRGHLGGYFLYIALAAGLFGLIFSGQPVQYPAFTDWTSAKDGTVFPMLFILIACGACSGFHSLIASGTTSKQLKVETDARAIGYGAMLLEAMVAIISLSCVMILLPGDPLLSKPTTPVNAIYANGIGTYLQGLRIDKAIAASFALLAFSTFVFDTLDVCVRLGRFIIQELIGRKDWIGRWIGTLLTAGVPVFFVMQTMVDANGKPIPIWSTFWKLFGASNQLLAALTLLGVTVWLWRTRHAMWVWLVTGLPCVWMYTMSSWALVVMTEAKFVNKETKQYQMTSDPVAWAGVVLLCLAALMLVEAIIVLLGDQKPRQKQPKLAAAGA